jgi:hypothetical protein
MVEGKDTIIEIRETQITRQQEELAEALSRIEAIQNMFSDAVQSDLEHGVKWLNENAAKEFHEKYPALTLAMNVLQSLT